MGLSPFLGTLNTGGSLPDLTNLHYSVPLPASLDTSDHLFGSMSVGNSVGNLPAAMTHLGIRSSSGKYSPLHKDLVCVPWWLNHRWYLARWYTGQRLPGALHGIGCPALGSVPWVGTEYTEHSPLLPPPRLPSPALPVWFTQSPSWEKAILILMASSLSVWVYLFFAVGTIFSRRVAQSSFSYRIIIKYK